MISLLSNISMVTLAQVVPVPDHTGTYLPAPAWLLEVLLLVTFWIHQLFVAAVLGSVLVLFVRSCCHLATKQALSIVDRQMIRSLPPVLSLTITTGIAPLLFVQALYGHLSYSSNILLGYFWLGSLVLLLVGFICLYFSGWLWNWKISVPALAILPVCFMGIAYIYTNNAILTIQPDHWLEFHKHMSWLHVKDPITIPRFLNNLSWSLMVGGLYLVWVAKVTDKKQAADGGLEGYSVDGTIRWGAAWHVAGVAVMIVTGLWYYKAMPAGLQDWLFGRREDNMLFGNVSLVIAALAAVSCLAALVIFMKPKQKVVLPIATVMSFVIVGVIVLIREMIRRWYVGRESVGAFSIDNWQVQSQNSAIAVFLVCFVIALAVVGWMLVKSGKVEVKK